MPKFNEDDSGGRPGFSQRDLFEGIFKKAITSLTMTGKIRANVYFIENQSLYTVDAEYPAVFFDIGSDLTRALVLSVRFGVEPKITFWKPGGVDNIVFYNLQDPTAYDKMFDDIRQFLLWSLAERKTFLKDVEERAWTRLNQKRPRTKMPKS